METVKESPYIKTKLSEKFKYLFQWVKIFFHYQFVLYLVKYSGFFQETEDLVRGDIPKQDLEVLYGIVFPPYII